MINVTKTYLPPLDQYVSQLDMIWQRGWITNNGPLTKQLTESLTDYLGVPNLELVANGTLALMLALKALDVKGEVITTPFSYVATATSILWEKCEPVFVDIENKRFCIDSTQIEDALTNQTRAILVTHVYGFPCDVENIDRIAKKYNLKVIYDAAHAFGVKLNGKSLMNYGDISALSFHATKLFHTAEGGALVCGDAGLAKKIWLMKKFGHIEENYLDEGINAKMSELHAAMGLCILPKVKEIIADRCILTERYDSFLSGHGLNRPLIPEGIDYNYAYYPVVFPSAEKMMRVRQALMENGIKPRRYFYPSLNKLPYLRPDLKRPCPVSEDIAKRVLCLPLYYGLAHHEIDRISKIIITELK